MATEKKAPLYKYADGMDDITAQNMERAWRRRERLLHADGVQLKSSYDSLQQTYYTVDHNNISAALYQALIECGKRLKDDMKTVEVEHEVAVSELQRYLNRPNRASSIKRALGKA